MLISKKWKNPFKQYNFEALGKPTNQGNIHPLMLVRDQIRQILL